MNIITAEELRELDACENGYKNFVQKNGSEATYLEALESNGIDDLLWYFDETDKLTDSQKKDLQQLDEELSTVSIELIKPYTDKYDVFLKRDESKRKETRAAALAAALAAAEAAEAAKEDQTKKVKTMLIRWEKEDEQ